MPFKEFNYAALIAAILTVIAVTWAAFVSSQLTIGVLTVSSITWAILSRNFD